MVEEIYIFMASLRTNMTAYYTRESAQGGSLRSHICDLLCPRMLPPPNHTPCYTHTRTHIDTPTHTLTQARLPELHKLPPISGRIPG